MSDEYSWVAIIYTSWILTPCKIYRKYFLPVDCYCTLLVNIIFAFLHHLTFYLSAYLLAGFCVIINHFFAMCVMFSCKSSIVLDNIFRSLSRPELNCGCGSVQFHSSHVDILLPYTIGWRQSLFLFFSFFSPNVPMVLGHLWNHRPTQRYFFLGTPASLYPHCFDNCLCSDCWYQAKWNLQLGYTIVYLGPWGSLWIWGWLFFLNFWNIRY